MDALLILGIAATFLGCSVLAGIAVYLLLERSRLWNEGGLATFAAYLLISLTAGIGIGLYATMMIFA